MEEITPLPPMPPTLLEGAPFGVALTDSASTLAWANSTFFRLTGVTPQQVGERLRDDPRWGVPSLWEAFDRAASGGSPTGTRAVRLPAGPGLGERFVDVLFHPLPPAPGRSRNVAFVVEDVTEREQERERAGLFYESFLTSTNAIEVTDREGILVDVNPAFERIYGYSRAECLGKRPNLVRSKQTPRGVYTRMWADLMDPRRGHWSGEIVNHDRLGREHPVFLTITAIKNAGGETTHYLGVAVDLTEQRAWERRAAHSDKLASLGQLAAGVAHEINTPLANVMLVAESIRRRSSDPWVRSRVTTITQQVENAAKIVRGLLDFARRGEPHVTDLDLREVTRDAVAFLRGKQSADVEVVESYPAEEVPISGDRGQIIQVLTNILNNAYEAMETSGRISVEVRHADGEAEVEIADSGPGIPENALPHIFEPFFTTKPEGRGTGLGLAICHGIMLSHHGSVTARNRTEGGASFLLVFPLAAHLPAE